MRCGPHPIIERSYSSRHLPGGLASLPEVNTQARTRFRRELRIKRHTLKTTRPLERNPAQGDGCTLEIKGQCRYHPHMRQHPESVPNRLDKSSYFCFLFGLWLFQRPTRGIPDWISPKCGFATNMESGPGRRRKGRLPSEEIGTLARGIPLSGWRCQNRTVQVSGGGITELRRLWLQRLPQAASCIVKQCANLPCRTQAKVCSVLREV